MARSRVGGRPEAGVVEERTGREAPFVLALARTQPSPPRIPLRGVGPHTGYGRRGKATAGGVSGSGRFRKGRGAPARAQVKARPRRRRGQARHARTTPRNHPVRWRRSSYGGSITLYCTAVPLLRIALLARCSFLNLKKEEKRARALCSSGEM